LSAVYHQLHESIRVSREDYEHRLREYARMLNEEWDRCLNTSIFSFAASFRSTSFRLRLRRWAEDFFGSTEIPFVAIDGSNDRRAGESFVIIYGGAYGSRGTVELTGGEARIAYRRWELSRDVSVVAFIPVPIEFGNVLVSEGPDVNPEGGIPAPLSDKEAANLSRLDSKVMQLAEVFLAYSLARSGRVDAPQLIMMDNTLSGWLANTSFGPRWLTLLDGLIEGERIGLTELYTMMAHPLNQELNVPQPLLFQPHLRLIAEAEWRGTTQLREGALSGVPHEVFKRGGETLDRLGLGKYYESAGLVELNFEPWESWRRCVSTFERVCETLFREKSPMGLTFINKYGERTYFTSKDLQFLSGIGLRALVEECWVPHRRILLVGVVKDSYSRYFYRNYLGSLHILRGTDVERHLRVRMADRVLLEMMARVRGLDAPWSTVEFDSSFMTLHPVKVNNEWEVRGYRIGPMPEVTRPPRLFLRSLAQFLLRPDRNLGSHVIFLDRPVYPGWDDVDADPLSIKTPTLGTLNPLYFIRPSRLHYLTMYMMSVLARNHFPEALGYPEPLHKADWGARSLRERVSRLLDSAWLVERSNPLSRTFRDIRESFRRSVS